MTLQQFQILWYAWNEDNMNMSFPRWLYEYGYMVESIFVHPEDIGSQESWFHKWEKKYEAELARNAQDRFANEVTAEERKEQEKYRDR